LSGFPRPRRCFIRSKKPDVILDFAGQEQVFFGGTPYVSAGKIASDYGFVRDYISRLCRIGKIRGRQIGKNWYVNEAEFKNFFIEHEHARALRRQKLATERRRDYQTAQAINPKALSSTVRGPQTLGRLSQFASGPAGVTDAALRAAHVPFHAISPSIELVHKILALTTAFVIVLGIASIADPQLGQFATRSLGDNLQSIQRSADRLLAGTPNIQAQVAAAVGNPSQALAHYANLARSLNAGVDDLMYAAMLTADLVRSRAPLGSDGSVTLSIEPDARPHNVPSISPIQSELCPLK
jgi:hypothetical protein